MSKAAPNLSTEELLALLRDASLKPESIAEEMEVAGVARPAPDQVARARQLVAQHGAAGGETGDAKAALTELLQLPELLGLAVLRAAGEANRSELLKEAAVAPQKLVAKEAKRELQRMKQKGVAVPEIGMTGAPVLKPMPEAEAPPCFASSVDAYGERALWWARPARGGGVEVVQLVLSDVKGIVAVDALSLSRKAYRDFVKRLPRGGVVAVTELPREHARWLVQQAEEAGARNGFTPHANYAPALQYLGPAPQERPPLPVADLDFGPDGELPYALAGPALFSDPLFVPWIPEEEAMRQFNLRVDEIAVSQLYLDEAQRQQALDRAAEDAAALYFTPARRARYQRRLEEMAIVLRTEGRIEAARTAYAVSRAMPTEEGPRNPFLKALFTHAMEPRLADVARRGAAAAQSGAAGAPAGGSGLIQTP